MHRRIPQNFRKNPQDPKTLRAPEGPQKGFRRTTKELQKGSRRHQKGPRSTTEELQKGSRRPLKGTRRAPEGHQKGHRRAPEGQQKGTRRAPEGHQKVPSTRCSHTTTHEFLDLSPWPCAACFFLRPIAALALLAFRACVQRNVSWEPIRS